jgi:hypothetical protein
LYNHGVNNTKVVTKTVNIVLGESEGRETTLRNLTIDNRIMRIPVEQSPSVKGGNSSANQEISFILGNFKIPYRFRKKGARILKMH